MENETYKKVKSESQDFSKMRIYGNLIFVKALQFFVNSIGLWFIDIFIWVCFLSLFIFVGIFDVTPLGVLFFIICHFVYWKYTGEKNANELINEIDKAELGFEYKALQDLKKEKYGKNKNL